MEVTILDNLLRPVDVVDMFESIIWSERFAEKGDFEMVTLSTPNNRRRFVTQVWLSINRSRRVMEIQRVEETTDADGRLVLRIKGVEIIDILDRRLALNNAVEGIRPVWRLVGQTPGDTMRQMFNEICLFTTVDENDYIPFIHLESIYPVDTIPEPDEIIEWEQKPASLYSAIKGLGDIYNLGFRLYKDPNIARLYFNVYAGSDRTTNQTVLPPVIFSSDMENLQSTTDYTDISGFFNTIHVILTYKNELDVEVTTTLFVYENDVFIPEGFGRRVKALLLTNVPEDVVDIEAWMIRAGKDELMKSRPVSAYDGEISETTQYVYERDYYLGDLIEQRGVTGSTAFMRVEEYIFVEDLSGERSYPTFVTKEFSSPGTWNSWKYDIEWSAMGSGEFWSNQ